MTLCQGITFWVIESDENALLLLIHSEVCDISTSLSGIFKIKPVHFSLTQITASDHNSGRRSGHLNWSDRNFKLAISNFVRSCSHTLSNWKCPDLKEVVSYWILMSGSPQDNQILSKAQAHFKTLLTYINFLKSVHKTSPYTNIKLNIYNYTQISNTYFGRFGSFNITPAKWTHKARTCWYHWSFCLIYWH